MRSTTLSTCQIFSKCPGVHAATRIKGEPFALKIGGGTKTIIHEDARYSTVYEIDGPHVLVSPEWERRGRSVAGQAKCVHILAIERTPCTRSFSNGDGR
jgi:hypothetical protein